MNDTIPNSIAPVSQPSVAPTTTLQQDKTLSGQRQVNIIWELTQAVIAIVITIGVVVVSVHNGLTAKGDIISEFPATLSNAFFLIVGFYFSRTNHQAIGGIGKKANEQQTYEGR
jgi:hypothetical protein